ncbi:MAG: single-stranded-DNA-specific exonuclease RecJ [Oscillospiraceae bacterium]|nr:single-stranded-DNA-specific exonuclease RecJ [Oscillospiraceae bacterium]
MSDKSEAKWIIPEHDGQKVAEITSEFKLNKVTAKLLINRGYGADTKEEKEKIKSFFNKSKNLLHDPFLMSGMERAVERVHKSFKSGEKVMIYGDYDVDGISSTCVMYVYFRSLGFDVCYYIPDRFEEGYGINKDAVKKAKDNNINLIITVDTGVTAYDETEYAKELGIDIIITDHHDCPKILPDAFAVINPKNPDCAYPFKELAGVGVAFKFILAYNNRYNKKGLAGFNYFDYFCQFVAMGTVADIMPLNGENRVMVDIGLKKMKDSGNYGIKAILDSYFKFKGKRNISSDIISFYIAPRLNAAGRLYKADKAVDLFLCESQSAADMISEELSVLNKQRQDMEKDIFIQAENEMRNINLKNPGNADKKIFILSRDNWNQGVIGIAASKLTEKYNKVFILLTKDNINEELYKGSCRSTDSINIMEPLQACSDILVKYGGHEKAAGLSVEYRNIGELDRRLNEYADNNNLRTDRDKVYNIECEIRADNINCDVIREIETLEPFGCANPTPLFMIANCRILNITPMGENKHLRLDLESEKTNFEAIYFNMELKNFGFGKYDEVDIACNAAINEYMNRERVQYIVRDMRRGGGNIPNREDFKTVYIFLLNALRLKKGVVYDAEYNIDKLYESYITYSKKRISRNKFLSVLDIFDETGIIIMARDSVVIRKLKIVDNGDNKIDIEGKSEIYKRL